MHELGIAQDLFKIIEEKSNANNLRKVNKVRIKVGVASGIEKDFLRHSLVDHIFPKTIAEGAELELIEEPLKTMCKECSKDLDTQEEFSMKCPFCGSFDIEITQGKDVYLESIEGEHFEENQDKY